MTKPPDKPQERLDASHLLTIEEFMTRYRKPRSWVYSHSGEPWVLRIGRHLRINERLFLDALQEGGRVG